MREPRKIIIRPHITEKMTLEREKGNKYAFEVAMEANKIEIKKAVEELFKVKVIDVKTMVVKGKMRRIGWTRGKRKDWKKAIVTLKPGDTIPLFEGV